MSTTAQKQHITSTPGLCGGKPCVAGTRVRVWDIAVLAQSGQSPDEILTSFPHLTLADVYAALAYYYDHRDKIEKQAAREQAYVRSLRRQFGPGPLEQKIRSRSRKSSGK